MTGDHVSSGLLKLEETIVLNQASLIGNLGRDPEIRNTTDRAKVATFQVATTQAFRDRKTGEKVERTEWHRVCVFGDELISKVIEPRLRKGFTVFVQGSLRTRKWTDQQGVNHFTTEIVVGGHDSKIRILREPGGNSSQEQQSPQPGRPDPATPNDRWPPADLDDEIPF